MWMIQASLQGGAIVVGVSPNTVAADLALPAQSQLNHMAVRASDMTPTSHLRLKDAIIAYCRTTPPPSLFARANWPCLGWAFRRCALTDSMESMPPGERRPGRKNMTHFYALLASSTTLSGNCLSCFITDEYKWIAIQTTPSALLRILLDINESQLLAVNLT